MNWRSPICRLFRTSRLARIWNGPTSVITDCGAQQRTCSCLISVIRTRFRYAFLTRIFTLKRDKLHADLQETEFHFKNSGNMGLALVFFSKVFPESFFLVKTIARSYSRFEVVGIKVWLFGCLLGWRKTDLLGTKPNTVCTSLLLNRFLLTSQKYKRHCDVIKMLEIN